MMDDVVVIVAVMRARRSAGSARYGAYAPANRRTETGATAPSCDRSDHSPSARTDQAASQRPLCGIIRIRDRGACQYQPRPDFAGDSRLPSHSPNSQRYQVNKLNV